MSGSSVCSGVVTREREKTSQKDERATMGVDDHQQRRLCVRGRSTRRSRYSLFEKRSFFEASSKVLSSLFFFVVFVVFAHNAFANGDSSPTKKKNPIKVLGYLPDWRIANETTSESIISALCARTDAIVLFSIEVDEVGFGVKADAARTGMFAGALQQIDADAFHPQISGHPFDMIGFFGNATTLAPQHVVRVLGPVAGDHREGPVIADQTLRRSHRIDQARVHCSRFVRTDIA